MLGLLSILYLYLSKILEHIYSCDSFLALALHVQWLSLSRIFFWRGRKIKGAALMTGSKYIDLKGDAQ